MVEVNNNKLEQFVACCSANYYINIGEKSEVVAAIMNKSSMKEIKLDFNSFFKEKFVCSYINLIGSLGVKYNSMYWWVTQTSAKNKFGSPFFMHLYIFWSIVTKLKEIRSDVLIINPPEAIVGSLKMYCRTNSIDIHIFHGNSLNDNSKVVKNLLMSWAYKFYFIYKIAKKKYISNKYFKHKFNKYINKNDSCYVLRSWFYPRSVNPVYRDSFFGMLPDYLIKRGKKLMIVAGIWEDYYATAKKIADNESYFIIPQEFFVKYTDPLKVIIDIYSNKIRIKGKIEFEGIDISEIFKAAIDMEFKGKQVLDTYIHYYYMKRLLSKVRVYTFTTTYENYPWEKVCFITLKNYSPDTKIIGYQHTVLSKASVNMFIGEDERDIIPRPDKIITIGKVTKNIMERYGNYDHDKIREGCGLRFEHLFYIKKKTGQKKNNNILVAPEGIFSESVNLVNFVVGALRNEEINIVIRAHPALPFEKFQPYLNFDNLLSNLSVSKNASVKEDLEMVDMVIYRGSSLSIEALMAGIPIIYVDFGDVLSVDPLFECNSLKWVVRTEKELTDTVKAIYDMKDEEYQEKLADAKNYLNTYIYEINDERLSEFNGN